jgi:hypothetical protein
MTRLVRLRERTSEEEEARDTTSRAVWGGRVRAHSHWRVSRRWWLTWRKGASMASAMAAATKAEPAIAAMPEVEGRGGGGEISGRGGRRCVKEDKKEEKEERMGWIRRRKRRRRWKRGRWNGGR